MSNNERHGNLLVLHFDYGFLGVVVQALGILDADSLEYLPSLVWWLALLILDFGQGPVELPARVVSKLDNDSKKTDLGMVPGLNGICANPRWTQVVK